jgi:hypothetical protein
MNQPIRRRARILIGFEPRSRAEEYSRLQLETADKEWIESNACCQRRTAAMIWSAVPAVSKNEAVTKFGFVRTNASATYSKGLSGAVIVEQTVDSAMDVGDGTGDRLA